MYLVLGQLGLCSADAADVDADADAGEEAINKVSDADKNTKVWPFCPKITYFYVYTYTNFYEYILVHYKSNL